MTTPETLEEKAARASAELAASRADARNGALNAVEVLLASVKSALVGETLKGCPNLIRGGKSPRLFSGYRVRAAAGRWDAPLEWPRGDEPFDDDGLQWGPEALLVDVHGRLVMARLSGMGWVGTRPVLESELRAEDAEKVANILGVALNAHIVRCERGDARYRRLHRLSDAIIRTMREYSSRRTDLRGEGEGE